MVKEKKKGRQQQDKQQQLLEGVTKEQQNCKQVKLVMKDQVCNLTACRKRRYPIKRLIDTTPTMITWFSSPTRSQQITVGAAEITSFKLRK